MDQRRVGLGFLWLVGTPVLLQGPAVAVHSVWVSFVVLAWIHVPQACTLWHSRQWLRQTVETVQDVDGGLAGTQVGNCVDAVDGMGAVGAYQLGRDGVAAVGRMGAMEEALGSLKDGQKSYCQMC